MPNINLKSERSLSILNGLAELERASSSELAEHLDIPKSTVDVTIKEFYKRGRVHVSGWVANKQGTYLRVYSYGEGADAKQPIKSSSPKKAYPLAGTPDAVLYPRCDTAASWLTHLMAQT